MTNSITLKANLHRHSIQSEYQYGKNDVLVLLPDVIEEGKQYPLMLVLPVQKGNQAAMEAIREVEKLDLHNKYGLFSVSPAFYHIPWYADHPEDKGIRQDSYIVNRVIPLIEQKYPVIRDARGRWLLGYSKSGWGAFSLLLRHPETFGRAVSWDAPLMMQDCNLYEMSKITGTQENFEKYQVTRLLELQANEVKEHTTRLIVLGHGYFLNDDINIHEFMDRLGIPHYFDHGQQLEHAWNSGWLTKAVQLIQHKEFVNN